MWGTVPIKWICGPPAARVYTVARAPLRGMNQIGVDPMRSKHVLRKLLAALPAFVLMPALASASGAPKFKVLHSFRCGKNEGCAPLATPTPGAGGELYGTAGGVVFKMSPSNRGRWIYRILRFLTLGQGPPALSSVARDTKGNLYGTGDDGGTHDEGTAWELTRTHAVGQ